MQRLVEHWVYGGFLAGLVMLALTPLLAESWALVLTLTYLALPLYMLHQYEEHDDDRFRRFVNARIAIGRRGLSLNDVFWINIAAVWGLLTIVCWLVARLDPGWAVIAAWLLVLNGLVHIVQAGVLRAYNPGLATAVLLFLPVGGWLLAIAPASLLQHALGFAAVVLLHGLIVVRAASRAPA